MLTIRLVLLPIGSLLILWTSSRSAQATPAASIPESLPAPIIFIGHPPNHHYVILIPTPNDDDSIRSHLAHIRDKMRPIGQIPFITQHRLGRYIYASSFTERSQAENIRQRFFSEESKARVVYFP